MTIIHSPSIEDAPSIAGVPASAWRWTWMKVCDLHELEPFWGEAALFGAEQLALFLLPEGRLFAVSNQDPATGSYVMSRGIVGSRGARPTIASPLHKHVFDLETGECFSDASLHLPTFDVRTDGAIVEVAMPRVTPAVSPDDPPLL